MKKPRSVRKRKASAIIAVIIVTAISAGIAYFFNQHRTEDNTASWITSGPFSLTNSTYRLGENVFMVVTGLKPTDVGDILIYDPHGGLFSHVPFNGTMKSEFNYFFKPITLKSEKLCSAKDIVGNWTIVFQGTSYKALHFRVLDQWIPGGQAEQDLQPVPPPC
ncbi:MAG: hypothetical protein KGI33_00785 [Thaumarchaeota archaeon]|nr:hypothetical protein [Nitrososphaerota archaeon]